MRKILFVFSFIFAFFAFSSDKIEAKVSSNDIFEVSVGNEILPISYFLVEDNEVVKERIQFNVNLKGLSSTSNAYKWEHSLCYKINGQEEVCEVDVTGDTDGTTKILSNTTYDYYFYDEDMGYYNDSIVFDYVTFKNKFICLDCTSNNEFVLDDISFNSEEINYKYSYGVNVPIVENNGKSYTKNYYSNYNDLVYVAGTFVNNSGSNLKLDSSPTYKIVNEVCIDNDACVSEEIDEVFGSNDSNKENPYKITPFLGNLDFYYSGSNLVYVDKEIAYEFARFKTTLVCLTNCESKRVDNSIVIHDEVYYFDYTKPVVDNDNTVIDTYDEVIYIKNSEVKITVNDSQSGIDDSRLKYYIVKPYSSYCNIGSETSYNYSNGESFLIGEGLTGGYCVYYTVYDKLGNNVKSDYYIYYFDNSAPTMSFENSYNSDRYYNSFTINPVFNDSQSGVKEIYYFWSKEIINDADYLTVKNNGSLFNSSIDSNGLIDGTYYLYFLAYDNLDNYKLYDLGGFNLDTIGLTENEVRAEKFGFDEGYSNTGTVKISIEEIGDGEEFKCGFFKENSVTVNSLVKSCYNNQIIGLDSGLEGEYNLFVYARDRANNYSLVKVLEGIKVDTKSPVITSDILYNDDNYHVLNEIYLNAIDVSGINYDSLKYGWFLATKSNVVRSDLVNNFVNNEKIGYPSSYYGEYKLYVSALDNLGNETFMSLDKIFKIDTDVVRISLVGEEEVTLLLGQEYKELGARAYKGDVAHGGRISEVVIEGEVNAFKAGTYYVTYSSGEGEFKVSVTRKVIIKSDVSYKKIVVSLFVIGIVVTALRLFIRRKMDQKYDNFDVK